MTGSPGGLNGGGSALNAVAEVAKRRGLTEIRLHLGCGGILLPGYVNVDLFPDRPETHDSSRIGGSADIYSDMRCLGLPPDSVDEIFTSHTFEHFVRWEAVQMLGDWHRILRPRGLLVIETPEFWRCVLRLFHPLGRKRRAARRMFYGNQWDRLDHETHRYLWSARELRTALGDVGYTSIRITSATTTHHPGRDMRVEARKGVG